MEIRVAIQASDVRSEGDLVTAAFKQWVDAGRQVAPVLAGRESYSFSLCIFFLALRLLCSFVLLALSHRFWRDEFMRTCCPWHCTISCLPAICPLACL